MNKGLKLLMTLALGYGFFWWLRKRTRSAIATNATTPHPTGVNVSVLTPLPPGATMTGRVERTNNTRAPGDSPEVVGYAVKDWAEVVYPEGARGWVEVAVHS